MIFFWIDLLIFIFGQKNKQQHHFEKVRKNYLWVTKIMSDEKYGIFLWECAIKSVTPCYAFF